jgi:hypothetical protein
MRVEKGRRQRLLVIGIRAMVMNKKQEAKH